MRIPTEKDKLGFFWGFFMPVVLTLITIAASFAACYYVEINRNLPMAACWATVSLNASITFFALKRRLCGKGGYG